MRFHVVVSISACLALVNGLTIYQDVFTNEDVFSDAYKFELVDDTFYFVYGKWIQEDESISEASIGGNQSAEREKEESSNSVWRIDLITSGRLENAVTITSYKEFLSAFTSHLRKLIASGRHVIGPAVSKHIRRYKDSISYYAVEEDGFELEGPPIVLKNIPAAHKEDEEPVLIVLKETVEPVKM